MLVDTHCHLDLMVQKNFDAQLTSAQIADVKSIITQAHAADVQRFVMVGAGLPSSQNSVACAATYSEIYAAIGLHPEEIKDAAWKERFVAIRNMLNGPHRNRIVGIGECGLDYFHPHHRELQADAFRAHIELALEHNLPLVIHSRDAAEDTLRIKEEYAPDIRGTMHCYSYDLPIAEQVISWNFVLGLGGTITYPKNNYLREVAQKVPLSSIILETDAPFLPPQHMRGKQNHPAEIKTIATYLAQVRQQTLEEVAQQTTQNAFDLFGLQ